MTIIYIFILLFIFLFLYYLLFRNISNIKYLSIDEFKSITNSSDFFNNMNSSDLIVRKSNNSNEYLKKYQLGYRAFTIKQKTILENIINIIENKIDKYNNFKNIKWIFVKIDINLSSILFFLSL
jgi:hypothetical protein